MKYYILIVIVLCMCVTKADAQKNQTSKIPEDIQKLLQQYACLACHKADAKLIGPAYVDVSSKKYSDQQIVSLIYEPVPSHWPGFPPMAPMKQVPKPDALKIAAWINSLAKKHH